MRYFISLFLSLCCLPIEALPKKELKKLVIKTEYHYSIPFHLLNAIIQQESSYKIEAVNRKGNKGVVETSYGLGQLTMDTAKDHCNLETIRQIYDPETNIECAAKVLQYQLNRYQGKLDSAVAAYQWGTPCECDGNVYKQKLTNKIRTCKKLVKGRWLPIRCNVAGHFWNQDYVDSVIEKRWKAHFNHEPFKYFPCEKKQENSINHLHRLLSNHFDIALLDKFLKIRVSDSLGCDTPFR